MSLINVTLNEDCLKAFLSQTRQKEHSFLVFKFTPDFKEVVLDHKGFPDATVSDLISHLPEHECRFATINLHYDEGTEGKRSKTMLILWAPMQSSVRARMLYASGEKSVKATLGNYGLGTTFQCGVRADLSEEALIEKCRKFAA